MNSKVNIAENHLDVHQAKWFAVYTGYKREKIVANLLDKKGIQVFLPLQKIRKQYVRKQKTVELPLFNCFVFVYITTAEYVHVLETEHVIKFIKIGQNLLAIPEKEIETIRCIIGTQIDVEAGVFNMPKGEPIEVIAGGLSGLRGKFIQQDSKYNFLVELEMLGYEMRMQVRPENLRRINTMAQMA